MLPLRQQAVNLNPTRLLLGLAALALGQALQNGNGYLTAPALFCLTLAILCCAAAIISLSIPFPDVSGRELWLVLTAGLVWQIYQCAFSLPGYYLLPEYAGSLWFFRLAITLAGLFALLSLLPVERVSSLLRRVLIVLCLAAWLAAGIWVIRTAPAPLIDTFMFQQTSSRALLQGQNPYELTEPNPYAAMDNYGAAWVKDGKMTLGNPYPPLSIMLSLTGYLAAGDIRYAHLAAILAAAVLMMILKPGGFNLPAAYLFLFTPRLFFVVEQSWSEALVLLMCLLVLYTHLHHPRWNFISLGLMLAIKQYMLLLLPLSLLLQPPQSWKTRLRQWAAAIGVAFLSTAPLAFWNFPAFLWNVGLAQFYQVFRSNALSYAALYSAATGMQAWQFLPFIMLALAYLFIWRFGKASATAFAAAMAFALFLFVSSSQQAFCNYYFLITALLCGALAVCCNKSPDKTP